MGKLYKYLTILISPFIKLYFYSRCLYGKDKIASVCNHFGVATVQRPQGRLIWVHAVSIGEAMSALTYIRHLKELYPDVNVLLTTITVTSADVIRSKIAKIPGCYHQFAVIDNPFWVRRFLNFWRIDAAIFLESEIWPNIVSMLHERRIPIYLLNARLSPRSFRRWKLLRVFLSDILKKFNAILAQSKFDKDRYGFFSPHNTFQIDNLKYANAKLPCNSDLLELFRSICKNKKILVAASTHDKEEEFIIQAHKQLKQYFDIITIIIPRHLTRTKDIMSLLHKEGMTYALRSEVSPQTQAEIFCIDSFGEVGTFFTLADVCFVGGSLVPIGGHNIYEPVALGKPVLHGPYMDNALEIRDFLTNKRLAFEVHNANDIANVCSTFFETPSLLHKIHQQALATTNNEAILQIDKIINWKHVFKSKAQ